MEWDPFLNWELGHAPPGAARPPTGATLPTDLDLWLVQLAYEVIARESRCGVCGARLGRSVRATPSPHTHPACQWQVTILTTCTGWRRHRHRADAVAGQDVQFGAFTRSWVRT
jgi:hypothetical protein